MPAHGVFLIRLPGHRAWRRQHLCGQQAPAGACVTQAEVPPLKVVNHIVVPDTDAAGKTLSVKASVALVGLHVVGVTEAHREFL